MIDRLRPFLGKNRWWVILSLTTICAGGIVLFMFASKEADPSELKMRANVHYLFRYYPRFKYEDCVARVFIKETGASDGDYFFNITETFGHFLFTHEPEAAAYSYRGEPRGDQYLVEFEFLDKCDKVQRIVERGLHIAQSDIEFEFSFAPDHRLELVKRGDGQNSWLDSPGYDATYWSLREEVARSCNPADWLRLAHYELEKNEPKFIYLSYLHASYASHLNTSNMETTTFLSKMSDRVTEPNRRLAEKIVPRAIEESSCDN